MPGKHTLKPNAILPFINETFALDAIKTRENPIKLKLVIQADCWLSHCWDEDIVIYPSFDYCLRLANANNL